MPNTGNVIVVDLISVRTDITDTSDPHYHEPLDANGYPTRLSGQPALTKPNTNGAADYIPPFPSSSSTISCPIGG